MAWDRIIERPKTNRLAALKIYDKTASRIEQYEKLLILEGDKIEKSRRLFLQRHVSELRVVKRELFDLKHAQREIAEQRLQKAAHVSCLAKNGVGSSRGIEGRGHLKGDFDAKLPFLILKTKKTAHQIEKQLPDTKRSKSWAIGTHVNTEYHKSEKSHVARNNMPLPELLLRLSKNPNIGKHTAITK